MHKTDEEKPLFEEQNIQVHTRAGEITKKRLQAQSLPNYKKMKTELDRDAIQRTNPCNTSTSILFNLH